MTVLLSLYNLYYLFIYLSINIYIILYIYTRSELLNIEQPLDKDHKTRYYEAIDEIKVKRKYSRTFDQSKYDDIFNHINTYSKKSKFNIEDDQLYFDGKRVVTLDQSFDLINELHLDNGHDKPRPLFEQLSQKYYGITRKMVETYIKNCSDCKQLEKVVRKQPVQPIIARYPRERVLIDLIDMNIFNKNFKKNMKDDDLYHFVLTVIDHYSNFTIIYSQKTKEQGETARNVANYINIFGPPKIIQADNGSEFVNKVVK